MDPAASALLCAGRGIVRNADQGGRRQVTLLSGEAREALMRDLGALLPASARRANLLLRGMDARETRRRIVQIGACPVRIFGETKPCAQIEQTFHGSRSTMWEVWGSGAFGGILDDGLIGVGDIVQRIT